MVANHSIQNTDEDDVEFYEGEHNKNGQRHGRGTLFLNSKRTVKFHGKFQHDLKEGRGCFYFADGSSLSGMFKDDCLNGVGVYTYDDGSTMVGTYSDGMLHGSCEEFNASGQLTFKGNYLNNMRIGVCQFFLEFGGTLFGRVNKFGKLSGNNIVYAYPDNKTFLKGQFEDGELVCAYPAVYSGVGDEFNPFSYKTIKGKKITKDVSTSFVISKSPLDEDIFESSRVEVKQSSNKNAGEGLFSCVHAQPGEVMSFYDGVRLTHKEVDERDWLYNDNTISLDQEVVIDVPKPWNDLKFYKASLGHKANHSFKPNCMYDRFNHPRFGKIKCIRTISFVQPGDELFVEYGYDHLKLDTDAPLWYQKALVEHLNNKDEKV
ncbi:histone-lysine N-methyltransferase SETD7 isoform X1 [Hydra vulgaris]|uniref:histone-lysine N-methyltransferase SETD7 isoform X1 n=1 Tax=Hydra vulgaris TaxID=6087 RepID=UPI001F5FC9B1|nr:histone-lysine N-methyltransferase SETD7 isoform X1 [Hydra vulgaris]